MDTVWQFVISQNNTSHSFLMTSYLISNRFSCSGNPQPSWNPSQRWQQVTSHNPMHHHRPQITPGQMQRPHMNSTVASSNYLPELDNDLKFIEDIFNDRNVWDTGLEMIAASVIQYYMNLPSFKSEFFRTYFPCTANSWKTEVFMASLLRIVTIALCWTLQFVAVIMRT